MHIGLLKVLQFISLLFEKLKHEKTGLHDAEITIAIPHLIEKSGHKSERHKAAFISTLRAGKFINTMLLLLL